MNRTPADMETGVIHKTNGYGEIIIIEHNGHLDVLVEFLDSGWRKVSTVSCIRRGSIKDLMKPTVLGIGYIGDGKHKQSVNGKRTDASTCWNSMLARCYCESTLKRQPTYAGCSVCDEWHNFQVFADWHCKNYPRDGNRYQLDKDIKHSGNKIYSPSTCIFVTAYENISKARGRHGMVARVKSPSGITYDVENISEFSRSKNLEGKSLARLISGGRKQYKGWTLCEQK